MGDMGELGDDSASLHRQSGELAKKLGIDVCFTLGELTAMTAKAFGPEAESFSNTEQLVSALQRVLRENRGRPINILVKGSRSMKMEQVIELLEKNGLGG